MGAIPIVNENDSVSYTEIESNDRLFGDNDMLSSVVAILCRASKLVIFSDIDGFYNCDPRLHPDAKLIEEIDKIDDEVYKLAGGAGSRRGTGGTVSYTHLILGHMQRGGSPTCKDRVYASIMGSMLSLIHI